jgi:hypothetical protein
MLAHRPHTQTYPAPLYVFLLQAFKLYVLLHKIILYTMRSFSHE